MIADDILGGWVGGGGRGKRSSLTLVSDSGLGHQLYDRPAKLHEAVAVASGM